MKITARREWKGDEDLQIRRGLRLVLSRFEGLISAVTVVVGEAPQESVQLGLRLRTGQFIEVSERNRDPAAGARQAAQRAASMLDRTRHSLRAPRMAGMIPGTRKI